MTFSTFRTILQQSAAGIFTFHNIFSNNSCFCKRLHKKKVSDWMYCFYRVSQKKGDLEGNCHWGSLGWAREKSRPIFLKFRKFPISRTQELYYFVKKSMRNKVSKMPTLTKNYDNIGHSVIRVLCLILWALYHMIYQLIQSLFLNMKFYCQNSMQINNIKLKHYSFIEFAERKIIQAVPQKL